MILASSCNPQDLSYQRYHPIYNLCYPYCSPFKKIICTIRTLKIDHLFWVLFGYAFGSKQRFPSACELPELGIASPLMFSAIRQLRQNPLHSFTRRYAAAAASRSTQTSHSALEQIERDGARLLKTVQRRVEERASLLALISDDMSSPDDVKNLIKAKELEPLKDAWDEWETNRQVRVGVLQERSC